MLKVYKCHVSLLLLLVLASKSGPLFAGDFHIVAEMSNQAINCMTKYGCDCDCDLVMQQQMIVKISLPKKIYSITKLVVCSLSMLSYFSLDVHHHFCVKDESDLGLLKL